MANTYKFVTEPVSGLECVICLEVAVNPWQHGRCGRLFCQGCLVKYGQEKPCPNCRREEPQYFEDNKSKRDIEALLVKCSNAECGDTMERQQLRKHVRTKCLYTVIPCKYQGIGCDTEMKREDMAAHEQDDKLHLHMALETVNLERQTLKNNGSITYAMPDFEKKRKAKEEFFCPPFYTHPEGYHMTLRMNANGWSPGEGTHVSVFAPILEGEYDAGLKWPLTGIVTITLLNQLEDQNHETKSMVLTGGQDACAGSHFGFPTFIPHSALAHNSGKNTEYLKDDILYFRVSVKVADHKPWLE